MLKKVNQIMSEDVTITSIYDKRGSSEDNMEIIDTIEDSHKLNPQERMEEKNVKTDLQKALQRLPERERVLLVLYYQRKHDYERNRLYIRNVRIQSMPASCSRYHET